ncbi:MAG: rod shape-determining protein MreC, partial [Pseudomonadota bacterium]|nr:rod shape-determining protein MreC [Pseudomonadota bacterium]
MTAVSVLQARCLAAAIVLVLLAAPCAAQEVDHSKMHHPPPKQAPPTKKPVVKKPAAKKPAAKPA